MATYKVIQDIEAEDKLVGPLTFRQFVYMGIAGFGIWLCYFLFSRGAGFLAVPLLPFIAFAAFFAFPWGKEQSTEVWALARVRFLFKPRKRIWDQSGIKNLVTVTVPKRAEQIYTDGLSQVEVRSRLRALATTIDSRGWAIKNPGGNPYLMPAFATTASSDDRLIEASAMPTTTSNENFDDVFDPSNSKVAQSFANMLESSSKAHHDQLVAALQQPDTPAPAQTQADQNAPSADYWFLNQPSATQAGQGAQFDAQVVLPGSQPSPQPVQATQISEVDEQALIKQLKANEPTQSTVYSHLPTILPLSEQEKIAKQAAEAQTIAPPVPQPAQQIAPEPPKPPVTAGPDAATINLSRNNDLNIETIARQAKKAHGDDEVVISLH